MPPRLGHRKSRNGCLQCKKRRVKCDEKQPCSNCYKHGVVCSLTVQSPAGIATPSQASSAEAQEMPTTETTSAPRTGADHHVHAPGLSSASSPAALTPSTPSNNPFNILSHLLSEPTAMQYSTWIRDLELMHHFTTSTSLTFYTQHERHHIWQIIMPREAFTHPFLMHGLLALSALHLACLKPGCRELYTALATNHQNLAISSFRPVLPQVTEENYKAVFGISSLISIFAFAWPLYSSPVNRATSAIDDFVQFYMLLKGCQQIVQSCYEWVEQGPLAPMLPARPFSSVPLSQATQNRFDRLRLIIATCGEDITASCIRALEDLELAYSRETDLVFVWPAVISQDFVLLIQQRHPAALVLLAHFCVLLHYHEDRWWLRGTDARILDAIVGSLEGQWRDEIQWPLEVVAPERYGVNRDTLDHVSLA